MRRSYAALIALLLVAPAPARADEPFTPYRSEAGLLATTPGTDDGPVGAIWNPAQWGVLERPGLDFFWTDRNARPGKLDNWGFAAGRSLGFVLRRTEEPDGRSVTDYQIGVGGGSGAHFGGAALGFSGGGKAAFGRKSFVSLGEIHRPAPWLSIGSAGRYAFHSSAREGIVDVGVRPLGDPRLLLFADYAVRDGEPWDGGALAGGVAVRPLPGVSAALRFGDRDARIVTVALTLQRTGFRSARAFDRDGRAALTHYVVRGSPPVRGIDLDARIRRGKRVLEIDLNGRATYRSYRLFDEGSLPLRRTLEAIDFAAEDPTIAGVLVHLSGYRANPEMAWEVRERLLALKRTGKTVVVSADHLSASTFSIASLADSLVMDPMGSLLIPGVQISRTYMKGLLAKLGIGFDEWRYFKYKSALEVFSSDSMPEPDREQLGAIVEETYGEFADGVAASGRSTRAELRDRMNQEVFLRPERLLELGWIDRIGTGEDAREIARTAAGRRGSLESYDAVRHGRWQPDEAWGAPTTIILAYALGECAMDEGIEARRTSQAMRRFRKRGDVAAVILRVDSPGGDPLASDVLARETRSLRDAGTPVIVSQGRVAGSGGYWISMDAESILTSPYTITASIGVIGGWFWNDGFGQKMGLTSDRVQVGKSADLFGGLRLPFLDTTLPERNLSDAERQVVEKAIRSLYDDFVNAVADARGLTPDQIYEIAEGRVYMGRAAVANGLADRVGGLSEAIESARRAAGIPPGRRVRIEEYPERPWFKLPGFLAGAFGGGRSESTLPDPGTYEARALEVLLRNPGRPLLLVPSELLPSEAETIH